MSGAEPISTLKRWPTEVEVSVLFEIISYSESQSFFEMGC